MKKLINGVVVDISREVMELFEKAAEGSITRKQIMNKIDLVLESDIGDVGYVIEAYYRSYAALPYPLYAVEDEIKYATIAANMQRMINDKFHYIIDLEVKDRIIRAHCEEGLYVDLASEHWAIETAEDDKLDPKVIDINDYKSDPLFKFFKWCDKNLKEKRNAAGFYAFALPGLLSACNNKPVIVRWEMAKLLQFADMPEEITVRDRCIHNNDTGSDYVLDAFWTGKYSSDVAERVMVIDCRPEHRHEEPKMTTKRRKLYDFEVYENNPELGRCPLQNSKQRFEPMFKTIIREASDVPNASYFGIIDGDTVAFEINNKVYTGKLGGELSETGVGVKLINVQGGKAYIRKGMRKSSGATRESIYIYDIQEDVLKVCNIRYKKENEQDE